MTYPNSMSMARTKESLTVDAEDSLYENDTSLLNWNSNSRMFSVQPQGVLKGLNTSFAATILRDPPETKQMTTERKQGRFRREIGSNLFRRMTRARFTSSLEIRNLPTLSTPIPSPFQFPPTLRDLLSDDFRYAVGRYPISPCVLSTIVHKFRILVVGKVCVIYANPKTQLMHMASQRDSGKPIFRPDMSVCTQSYSHSCLINLCALRISRGHR